MRDASAPKDHHSSTKWMIFWPISDSVSIRFSHIYAEFSKSQPIGRIVIVFPFGYTTLTANVTYILVCSWCPHESIDLCTFYFQLSVLDKPTDHIWYSSHKSGLDWCTCCEPSQPQNVSFLLNPGKRKDEIIFGDCAFRSQNLRKLNKSSIV